MNKSVQILLLFALLPSIGMAREETLEERKTRIVRKYLREQMTIEQSNIVVPDEIGEDERIIDSEKFKEVESDLQRQGDITTPMMMPPRRLQRPMPRANSNWLLNDDEDLTDDADSYSGIDSADNLWSDWGEATHENSAPSHEQGTQGSYDPGRNESFRSEDSGIESRTGLFGRTQDASSYSSGLNRYGSRINTYGTRINTYGSDSEQEMLASPFSRFNASGRSSLSTEQEREQGYKPYVSPYAQQRADRLLPESSRASQAQEEFQRPNAYEQWKQRDDTWDPTSDDAYLNEIMQNNR
ncbi:MAG: hypothetical protein V5783_04525 [Pontiella sp.]